MKKAYYAVRKGITPGIYSSWEMCKKMINGYSGAEYKKFNTIDEAKNFMMDRIDKNIKSENNDSEVIIPESEEGVSIYVDGSYRDGVYSYGYVILDHNENIVAQRCGKGNDLVAATMNNVAGELSAVMRSCTEAKNLGYKEIIIVHDYTGIREWPLGKWKAKNTCVQQYVQFMHMLAKNYNVRIYFKKVKGHSCNKYNDMADALAKKGLIEQ